MNKYLISIIGILIIFILTQGVFITKNYIKSQTYIVNSGEKKNYPKAPVIFVDHGSPQRFLEDNHINKQLKQLGNTIKDNIKGVIYISAHNLSTQYTYISNIERIPILYDFSGFPQELYNIQYNVKGDLELSQRLHNDIEGTQLTHNIKNDHGIWTILKKLFPLADKKVSILTINMDLQPNNYFEIGNKLKKYREEGYLIITSGSILHNFDLFDRSTTIPQSWAQEFNNHFLSKLETKDFESIKNYQSLTNVNMAFKTKDHYVPVIYAIGAVETHEKVEILSKEITIGSLSNNLIIFGEY